MDGTRPLRLYGVQRHSAPGLCRGTGSRHLSSVPVSRRAFLSATLAHGLTAGYRYLDSLLKLKRYYFDRFCTPERGNNQVLLCLARAEADGFECRANTAALRIFA